MLNIEVLGEKSLTPNLLQWIAIKMLATGPLPTHIAVIMDGNRRWAKQHNLPGIEGHRHGATTLDLLCRWLEYFEIPEVTCYAFSTDNFKRSPEEVNAIMNLLGDTLQEIIEKIDVFNKRGVRICIYGNLELLPPNQRSLSARVMLLTKDNQKRKVNMAIAYKATEEIERARMLLKIGVDNGELLPSDIDEDLLSKCLYSGTGHRPDFLVRTSGEYRLSDFMLWQSLNRLIYITIKNWPDLSFIELFKALFYYQFKVNEIKRSNKFKSISNEKDNDENDAKEHRIKNFLKKTEIRRNAYLCLLSKTDLIADFKSSSQLNNQSNTQTVKD